MKSVITVTQIDGARVQVNSQNIEAIMKYYQSLLLRMCIQKQPF